LGKNPEGQIDPNVLLLAAKLEQSSGRDELMSRIYNGHSMQPLPKKMVVAVYINVARVLNQYGCNFKTEWKI